jgi:D-alanine-D-alanine ligase
MSTISAEQFGKVAVMYGGTSAEREVSLKSGMAVYNALKTLGVDAHLFDPKEQALTELKALSFDRVFIVLHGRGGEDGTLQGALEYMQIPYTGSGLQGSALAMDKVRSKYAFLGANVPTAPFRVVRKGKEYDAEAMLNELNGKVMVKPANEGSSIGMAEAHEAKQLCDAIQHAFKYDTEVLVEQWVTGKELTVSIVNGQVLPAIEMRTSHEFYDYDAKYVTGDTEYICPAPISSDIADSIAVEAQHAFDVVGAKGWGRVDILLDENNTINVLEVNTIPGMTETSLVPKAAAAAGIDFNRLVYEILRGSL